MRRAPSPLIRSLKEMFAPFWKLWLVCFGIAGVSWAVLQIQAAYPGIACTVNGFSFPWTQCFLGDSTRTPWGIVTAFFVHTSFAQHYLPNMVLLFVAVFVFCVMNAPLSRSEKRFRQRVFIDVMFLSGIAANFASLFFYGPIPTVGASGLDFAALGITLAFCVVNVFPRIRRRRDLVPYYRDPLNLVWSMTNGLLAAGLILVSTQFPVEFLSIRPGVNVVAHLFALVFAVAATMTWVACSPRPVPALTRNAMES